MKNLVDKSILPNLIGKTIKWECPIYKANLGHYGYGLDGGTFILKAIDLSAKKPIVEVEIIEGADPKFIFVEKYENDNILCYSDSDRFVYFEYEN